MRALYNRYIPDGAQYARVPAEDAPRQPPQAAAHPQGTGLLGGLLGSLGNLGNLGGGEGVGQALNGLLKRFHLENLDAGDILLALIVLLLILEDGDNLDLIITLGLMILFSLGEP